MRDSAIVNMIQIHEVSSVLVGKKPVYFLIEL
jgi:hypothetical protein